VARAALKSMAGPFYPRYLMLLDEIERLFPVSEWRSGDLEIWPLARMDLYLDMYWADAGVAAPRERSLPLRIAGRLAMPLRNRWKSRHDIARQVTRPTPAHAIFLGDGFSLDLVDGQWRDRFGEPLIAALEARGHDTFLMQGGYLGRLPWRRPTFAANVVESRGFLQALVTSPPAKLPGHDGVLEFLTRNAVHAPSLSRIRLERRAKIVAATAAKFEHVLSMVKPTVAFVVAYYAGLGPAFLLACRRLGILSVDLQRSPHGGLLHAYRWAAVPARGYATLPTVFWSWTKDDAARVDDWANRLAVPWHSALHGGHTQLAHYSQPMSRTWDARFASIDEGATFEREILVALQPIHGHRGVWDALCSQIEASPASWRWWIRRHPASRPDQDAESARLLALRRRNVNSADASTLPLPVLLPHMSAVLSLSSGAAWEASMFDVPAFFLIDAARHSFADLITRGAAAIIDVGSVNSAIARIPRTPIRAPHEPTPAIDDTLLRLEERARTYRHACLATPAPHYVKATVAT
jgi:hypothetical protein